MNEYGLKQASAVDSDVSLAADPALVFAMSRVQDAVSRALRVADITHKTADRIFGATPQPADGIGSTGPKSDGSLAALQSAIDRMHSAIGQMEDAAARFNLL
jgi:hypothetical protein